MTSTPKTIGDAAKQLEAVLMRQMLTEAKVFGSSESAGSHVYADMFVNVVADAVAHAGGLGIAGTIERSLTRSDPHGTSPAGSLQRGAHALEPAHTQLPTGAGLEEALLVGRKGHVTSPYGERTDPIDGHHSFHHGIDIAAPRGTPIRSMVDGVVKKAGEVDGYGLVVEIESAGGLTTKYAHADRLLVTAGQRVAAGDVVADVGSTGRSTGPHVHVETRIDGKPVDPAGILGVRTAP